MRLIDEVYGRARYNWDGNTETRGVITDSGTVRPLPLTGARYPETGGFFWAPVQLQVAESVIGAGYDASGKENMEILKKMG
jgi:hypothetical protein